MNVVYLDNNATTRPAPEVVEAMLPYLTEWYGNASSLHRFGQRARQAIDEARGHVAQLVGCAESELMFTGGGTEAVNTAVRGIYAARAPRRRIVTSTGWCRDSFGLARCDTRGRSPLGLRPAPRRLPPRFMNPNGC